MSDIMLSGDESERRKIKRKNSILRVCKSDYHHIGCDIVVLAVRSDF